MVEGRERCKRGIDGAGDSLDQGYHDFFKLATR